MALAQDQVPQSLEGSLAALGWVKSAPLRVLDRNFKKGEQGPQHRAQRFVECQRVRILIRRRVR